MVCIPSNSICFTMYLIGQMSGPLLIETSAQVQASYKMPNYIVIPLMVVKYHICTDLIKGLPPAAPDHDFYFCSIWGIYWYIIMTMSS